MVVHALTSSHRLRACRGLLRTLPVVAEVDALYARMPPSLERALLPFQREGVRFGLAHGGCCLLAGAGPGGRPRVVGQQGGVRMFRLLEPCPACNSHNAPGHPAADEMGVGKTVQAIALASCYEDEWPLLVVVPASLRLVWAEELERWLPHLRPSSIHVIEGKEHRVAQVRGAGRGGAGQGGTGHKVSSLVLPQCAEPRWLPPPSTRAAGLAAARGHHLV